VAIKALAHTLARACFHVMKSGAPFDVARAFRTYAQVSRTNV